MEVHINILVIFLFAALVLSSGCCLAAAFFACRAAVAARDASANCYLALTDSSPPPVPRKAYHRPYRVG